MKLRSPALILAASLTLAAATPAAAADLSGMYGADELEAARTRYAAYLTGLFYGDLLGALPLDKRQALADVRLASATDPANGFPLMVGASPATRVVSLPLRTVRFLDDLASLVAWLESRGCTIKPAQLYVAKLASGKEPSFGWPDPKEAFGLTDAIYDDKFVRDVSSKLTGSVLFFVLAHELGHIYHSHVRADGMASVMQEEQADSFALDAAAHVGLFPGGLAIFFASSALLEGFSDTHPLSGARAAAVAARMRARPQAFVDRSEDYGRWKPVVLSLADQITAVSGWLDDPRLRGYVYEEAEKLSWEELPASCP